MSVGNTFPEIFYLTTPQNHMSNFRSHVQPIFFLTKHDGKIFLIVSDIMIRSFIPENTELLKQSLKAFNTTNFHLVSQSFTARNYISCGVLLQDLRLRK